MNIGDRVKFVTMGGWYNSGIIRDMDEDSYLIEVDEIGCKPPEGVHISLPYYARVLSCEIELLERTRWIPISKMLPSRDECIKNNGLLNVSDGNRSYSEWFDIDKQRFGEPTMTGFRVDYAVTHWTPLPEPYKAEGEE